MSTFTGFPARGIQFLRELSENNNKAWFEANKPVYIEALQTPAVALVEALGSALQARFPEIQYDTRTNGSGSLMRLYRDTRFSADKSPYKTNVAMVFTSGGKKMEAAAFGLQITLDAGVEMYAGSFGFNKDVLDAYRQAVLNEKQGAALEQAVNAVTAQKGYSIGGETYKRVPNGLDADHPRARWLKFTALHAFPPALSLEVAQTPELVDAVMAHFVAMTPIYLWVRDLMRG
jgi:uncharacterized protein (TIGR02453 family)